MQRRRILCLVLSGMIALTATSVEVTSAGAASSSQGVTSNTVKVAILTSLTGPIAPLYANAVKAFEAPIDAQNAKGGVDGRKIVVVPEDDASSVPGALAAAQDAVGNKDVFALAAVSTATEGPTRYLYQQGVPVVGASYEGGFGTLPYTNMFGADTGSIDQHYPAFTLPGTFYKEKGATNVAVLGFTDPGSTATSKAGALSFKKAGLKVGYENLSLSYGNSDFSTEVVAMKNAGIDAIYAPTSNTTELGLYKQAIQAGIKVKVMDQVTTYGPALAKSSDWNTLVKGNAYFQLGWLPAQVHNAASAAMMANLEQYGGYKASDFPDFGAMEGYLAATLFIKGLQVAGKDLTRQSFINNLRQVKSYNANGLIPETINFSTVFGHDPNPTCYYFLTAKPSGFVPLSNSPVCGTKIPNSNQIANPASVG
ncbi:MAG TPA: ABC transporter substrate-binding protein [Acidimicrobiales bacterium]|jgi:branched-chain amino acid transport system substrate-binding protein|nr:ABC transporter substrate-binding protein [Acidimicrobiales bacterium]